MKTVKDIYDFFQQGIDSARKDLSQLVSSDPDFMIKNTDGKVIDANMSLASEYYKVCERMVNDTLMMRLPSIDHLLYLQNIYVSLHNSSPKHTDKLRTELEYGSYDYKYRGFVYTRDCFTDSVLPICGIKQDDEEDIGTAFCIGNNRFVTAAHCIKDLKSFNLLKPDGNPFELKEVWFVKDQDMDIFDLAVLTVKEQMEIKSFRLGIPAVLDDVLIMGYPPIAGFNAILTSETATVGAYQKSSTGQVVGADKPYGISLDFFLINARVKGGNSGGPVINNCGEVIGVVVKLPLDIKSDSSNPRYDLMGYGICLPSKYVIELMQNHDVLSLSHDGKYYHI